MLTPAILKPLRDKRVIKIACGESHSLVLKNMHQVLSLDLLLMVFRLRGYHLVDLILFLLDLGLRSLVLVL